jgi:hypothetical protein
VFKLEREPHRAYSKWRARLNLHSVKKLQPRHGTLI